jgi:hypothetical protein
MLGFSSLVRSGRQREVVFFFLFVSFLSVSFLKHGMTFRFVGSTRLDRPVDMSGSSLSECIKRTEDKLIRIPLLPEREPGFQPLLL